MADLTLTAVSPGVGKAGDVITLTGTEFAESPSATKVWRRDPGGTWAQVNAARVVYKSATSIEVTLNASDSWTKGLQSIGVSASAGTEPSAILEECLLFFAAGTFNPDAVIKGALEELYLNGEFLGHTTDAFEIEHDTEESEVKVQQSRTPVRTVQVGETFTVNVPLGELSLENLKRAFGSKAAIQDLGGTRRRLSFGGGSEAITYGTLLAIVPAATGKKWAVGFYRVKASTSGAITWSLDDVTSLPLKITCLADTSRAADDQVGFVEEYAAA